MKITLGWAVVVAIGMSSLSGCATLTVEECQQADWQTIGYRDGKAGQDVDYILKHNKACAKSNITPNKVLWEQGRQQGLTQYCTADNALSLGRSGYRINAVCPSHIAPSLKAMNDKGLAIYNLKKSIDSDKKERDNLIDQYNKLKEGNNLDFKTEKEARIYLTELPYKINMLTDRIHQNVRLLQQLSY